MTHRANLMIASSLVCSPVWRRALSGCLLLGSALAFPGCLLSGNPGAPEDATPVTIEDRDRDGYTTGEGDCDDLDSSMHPGAAEAAWPDGKDNDCDGLVDEGMSTTDDDKDGFSESNGDCDDSDPNINPHEHEVMDGVDQDCDGLIDEDLGPSGNPVSGTVQSVTADDANIHFTSEDELFVVENKWIKDLDGDGLDELAVGVTYPCWGGLVFLIYGREEGFQGYMDFWEEASAIFYGIDYPNLTGFRVAGGGDLDGDGFNDLVIGDLLQQRVSLYRGGERWVGEFSPADADAVFLPISSGAYNVGLALSIPGDVTGDGEDDLIIGQPGYDNWRGRVFVFAGGRPYQGFVELETAYATLEGAAPYDFTGGVVGSLGDMDGDGIQDFFISAPDAETAPQSGYFGLIYFYYGSSALKGVQNVSQAPATLIAQSDALALQVSAGDFDGDGKSDVVIGFPFDFKVLVFYGGKRLSGRLAAEAVAGTVVESTFPRDMFFGAGVSLEGDLNADGAHDLVVSAPWGMEIYWEGWFPTAIYVYVGEVAVIPGGQGRPEVLRAGVSRSTIIEGIPQVMGHVWPLSAGGDFDGDGQDDLSIGSETFFIDEDVAPRFHALIFNDLPL